MEPSTQPWTLTAEQLSKVAESIATVAALFVGALWTYWIFVRTRQHSPRADISQTIVCRKILPDRSYIGVTVTIKNIGSVAIDLKSVTCTVQQIEPWPSELPTKLCAPSIDEPDALPPSGELNWPSIGICEVDLKECHVEAGESHVLKFDFVANDVLKTAHVYTHIENKNVKRHRKEVPIGWSCRSTEVFSLGDDDVTAKTAAAK